MPDNMSPEKSSIDYMRSLGSPAVLPGTQESAQAAKDFPQPEFRSDLPDVRMDLKDGENEDEHQIENEAESQKYTRRESLADELINAAETPQELYTGLRMMEKILEESFIPPNLQERYTPPRSLSAMHDRAEMLHYSIQELRDFKWIKDYNPSTGEAKLKDRRFAALAIKTEVEEVDMGRYTKQKIRYYFGRSEDGGVTSKEREVLEKAYREAMVELAAKDIFGEHFGLRDSTDIRDSLEALTAYMHMGRTPKLKPEHLRAIFNMPGIKELETNPENTVLGDQVEEAIFLNLVMLSSGNKERMKELLDRPGSKCLINEIAEKWGVTYEQWVRENIGVPDEWKKDSDRFLTAEKGVPPSWKVEAEEGFRGSLTKYSNIVAWGGDFGEFGKDKEDEFIGKTIGGLVGSVEAAWTAGVIMRAIGAYASEGYVALPNGKSLLPLGEARFMSGDDTGKFWAYMFNMKEAKKGRSSGLKDMIGRIPDMAMNLFDWAQVIVSEPDKDGVYRDVKRSIWDAWLGTAGGKPIKDLLTGEDVKDKFTVEEPYNKLGKLNFNSLEREFHNTFTVMQWLQGNERGPTGVSIEAMNVEDFKFEDFSLKKLKMLWKYIDITMNSTILTKGSQHLYDLDIETDEVVTTVDLTNEGVGKIVTSNVQSKAVETVKRRFFKNLMAARVRSSNFMFNILPATIKIPNLGSIGGDIIEIPAANIIELYINEILRKNPEDEEGVIKHYIDDFARIDALGKKVKDAIGIRKKAQKWQTNNVGRVTGKKRLDNI